GADRDLPVTGRADRSVRALPPSGIAFHVVLVAPPRPVRGPGRAEWVPSAGTSNGPLPAPRPRPTISAPARGGSGTVPSPFAPMLPSSAGGQRPDRRPASDGPPLRRTRSPPHGPSAALPHPSPHRAREGRRELAPRGHPGRRFRRGARRRGAARRPGAGDPHRPQRLQDLPAAAVPGGDRRPEPRRRHHVPARPLPQGAEHALPPAPDRG